MQNSHIKYILVLKTRKEYIELSYIYILFPDKDKGEKSILLYYV